MHDRLAQSWLAPKTKKKKLKEKKEEKKEEKNLEQKSPGHQKVRVLNCQRQTNKQTDGHCNSMTESAQWADSVKIILRFIKEKNNFFLDKFNCASEILKLNQSNISQ